jgi:hypothetical protein
MPDRRGPPPAWNSGGPARAKAPSVASPPPEGCVSEGRSLVTIDAYAAGTRCPVFHAIFGFRNHHRGDERDQNRPKDDENRSIAHARHRWCSSRTPCRGATRALEPRLIVFRCPFTCDQGLGVMETPRSPLYLPDGGVNNVPPPGLYRRSVPGHGLQPTCRPIGMRYLRMARPFRVVAGRSAVPGG